MGDLFGVGDEEEGPLSDWLCKCLAGDFGLGSDPTDEAGEALDGVRDGTLGLHSCPMSGNEGGDSDEMEVDEDFGRATSPLENVSNFKWLLRRLPLLLLTAALDDGEVEDDEELRVRLDEGRGQPSPIRLDSILLHA